MPEGYEDDYRANEPFWKESYDWVLKKDRMWSETIWFMTFDYPQSMQPGFLVRGFTQEPWPYEVMNGTEFDEALEKWTTEWHKEVGDFNSIYQ